MTIAKKRFGQNFLVNEQIIEHILRVINPEKNQPLIEIGPGLGALTKPLLQTQAQLSVIEIDRDLIASLEKLKSQYPNFHVYAQDALQFDFLKNSENGKWRVLGNLPYNISSPLLLHCFDTINGIQDMHFMLQKEVVDRLSAVPDSKDYGRLTVITQYFCDVEYLFEVPADSFNPAPKVTSAFFRLIPKKNRLAIDVKKLALVTQHAFGQRRKKIANALGNLFTVEDLVACGLDPHARAENISVQEYCLLAEKVVSS